MYNPSYDSANKELDASGNVTAWWTMFPQVAVPDPMSGPDPDAVLGYVLVHVIAACSAGGNTGCGGFGAPSGLCGPHGLYPTHKIVIDQISCINCGTDHPGLKPALVK